MQRFLCEGLEESESGCVNAVHTCSVGTTGQAGHLWNGPGFKERRELWRKVIRVNKGEGVESGQRMQGQ